VLNRKTEDFNTATRHIYHVSVLDFVQAGDLYRKVMNDAKLTGETPCAVREVCREQVRAARRGEIVYRYG
jgi:hypothetical protein